MGDIGISIPSILGLPPESFAEIPTNALKNNAFPIAKITPCESRATYGATVFEAEPAWGKYKEILALHGYDYSGEGDYLTVCFQADNFPSDSFQNEYGQSFLESATQMVGSNISDLAQMVGDPKKVVNDIRNSDLPGSSVVGAASDAITNAQAKVQNSDSQMLKNIGSTVTAMATGGRVDFPMVWKNSSFTPSYSMTIRLYNPSPASEEMTQKYIVGPLAALMILSCPQSEDGNIMKWPFLHRIEIPGISNIIPAFISNVSVIKGGDQQQIAWNQRLGIVDVRIDFGSLFNSMIIETKEESMYKFGEKRPTLSNYLNAMSTEKPLETIEMTAEIFSSLNNGVNFSGMPKSPSIPSINSIGNISKLLNNPIAANANSFRNISSQFPNPTSSANSIGNIASMISNPSTMINSARSSIPGIGSLGSIGSIGNMNNSSIGNIPSNLLNQAVNNVTRNVLNTVANKFPGVSTILDVVKNVPRKLPNPSSIANNLENVATRRISQELSSMANNIKWTV